MNTFNPLCCFCKNEYDPNLIKWHSFFDIPWETPSEKNILEFFQLKLSCWNCTAPLFNKSSIEKNTKICFNCFSTEQKTLICKEEPYFFHPKIDEDLFPRFIKMLNGFEQYYLTIFSKNAAKFIESNRLIVTQNLELSYGNYYIPDFDNSYILLTEKLKISSVSYNVKVTECIYGQLFSLLSSNILINNAKIVEIKDIKLSKKELFLLLSSKTSELILNDIEITSTVKFSEILLKLPKIIRFTINRVNITFDNLWTLTLEENCKFLYSFVVPYESLNLTRQNFRGKIKEWSKQKVRVLLNLNEIDVKLCQNLTSYSVETDREYLIAKKTL